MIPLHADSDIGVVRFQVQARGRFGSAYLAYARAARQRARLFERSEGRFVNTLPQRSYSILIFSSLSRLAAMDSSTELVPLIHAPPSRRRSSGKGP